MLEHSFAAGKPDAGFYIGQCYPCDDVISEHNGLGYSGANAGGNLLIVNSTFRNNRVGVVPSSGSFELCYPERETTIVGNLVYDNNQPDTPAIDIALLAMGNGIVVAGGKAKIVERNRVYDHDLYGILLVTNPEDGASDEIPPRDEWDRTCEETLDDPPGPPIEGTIFWESYDNRVVANVVSDNRLGDLGAAVLTVDPTTAGNCFAENTCTSSAPAGLETLAPCDGVGTGGWTASPVDLAALLDRERPVAVPFQDEPLPDPPELPDMPDAATAPARPATDVPFAVDLDAIAVPNAP